MALDGRSPRTADLAREAGLVDCGSIERLVATFPLERVVALVDGTTDARVLQEVLDRAAASAPRQPTFGSRHGPL